MDSKNQFCPNIGCSASGKIGQGNIMVPQHRNIQSDQIIRFSAIYKDRWEIELFFKTIKQNLKIKSFVGTTENAVLIQIWTALIALLLLRWLHHLSKFGLSFSNLATLLRMNLFIYRDLETWINNPFSAPP